MKCRIGLLLFAFCALAIPAFSADGITPRGGDAARDIGGIDFEERLGEQIPLDLTFRDEAGEPITLDQCVNGKPTILVLAYYRCPHLCTQVLNDLADAIQLLPLKLGDEYNVLTVSFDPKETYKLAAEKKDHYLKAYNISGGEKGWHFLTGQKDNIDKLCEAAGFRSRYDKVFKEFKHAAGIMIVTPSGKLSKYFYGLGYANDKQKDDAPKEINPHQARDLRFALIEASDGKIGSPFGKLLLTCYTWDHKTGTYTFNVMMAVKIGGAVTLLLLTLGVSIAHVRERRRRPRPLLLTTPIATEDASNKGTS